MPSRERVQAFIAMVEQSQFVEAIENFYHAQTSLQIPRVPQRYGIRSNADVSGGFAQNNSIGSTSSSHLETNADQGVSQVTVAVGVALF